MTYRPDCDVSVVLPFNDDEDVIGAAVRRVSSHLRDLERSFEVIAVDEYSGDNSHAVLALLRRDCPELRIVHVGARGRGYDCGVRRAAGRILWLVEPASIESASASRSEPVLAPLAPFDRAFRRVDRGERDVVVVGERFVVAHAARAARALRGIKGLGPVYRRRVVKRAGQLRLDVESQVVGGAASPLAPSAPRGLARLIGALAPARSGFVTGQTDRDRW